MEQKAFVLQNKGMNRDLSISKAGESSAWENRNIRITADEHDTLLSVTNERGNKKIDVQINGRIIGYNVLGKYMILFTCADDISYIYRLEYVEDTFKILCIYGNEGADLGFEEHQPIESIVDYETEDVQKIYWIDGLHVLRSLNFSDTYLKEHLEEGETLDDEYPKFDFSEDATFFDSTHASDKFPRVSITKDNSGNTRVSGVAQYFVTYYNKHGVQTGIVYASPLVYLAPNGRGGAADETNNNRVVLTLSGLDGDFDYVRLYGIVRTSQDGQVSANIISEAQITDGVAVLVDDGAHYETIDPTELLYLGSRNVVAGTMTQKDGTLFLGNLVSSDNEGVQDLETMIKEKAFVASDERKTSAIVSFERTSGSDNIPGISQEGLYPYESQLQYTNAEISTFKGGEKYRFALRFIRKNGTMSKAFWIGDAVNPYYPQMNADGSISRAVAKCSVPTDIVAAAKDAGFCAIQLMIADATYADRSVQAQGIVNPTVFNLYDRYVGNRYAQASWIYRPRGGSKSFSHFSPLGRSNTSSAELQMSYWESVVPSPLYYTEGSAMVAPPDGYKAYTHISYWWDVYCSGWWWKAYWGYFGVQYINKAADGTSTVVLEKKYDLGTAGGGIAEKVVEDWLNAYNDCSFPASFRMSSNDMYTKLTEAKYEVKMFEAGHRGDRQTEQPVTLERRDNDGLFASMQRQHFFVDENVVTLNSPEIEYEAVNLDRNSGLKFRIVGVATITGNISDYTITTDNGQLPGNRVLSFNFSHSNPSDTPDILTAWPLYSEYGYSKNSDDTYSKLSAQWGYMTYMWHKSGSIPPLSVDDLDISVLKTKRFANLSFSPYTIYNDYRRNIWSSSPSDIRQLSAQAANSYEVKDGDRTELYSGNTDMLVAMPSDVKYPVYYTKDNLSESDTLSLVETNRDDTSGAVRWVSDPIHMAYKSKAHALISLNRENKETLLPFINRNTEKFKIPSIESKYSGPFAPWRNSAGASGAVADYYQMWRELKNLNDNNINTFSVGAYEVGTVTLNSTADKLSFDIVDDGTDTTTSRLTALSSLYKKINTYKNAPVFVHILGGENNEEQYLVDVAGMQLSNLVVTSELTADDSSQTIILTVQSSAAIRYINLVVSNAPVGTAGYTEWTLIREYNLEANKQYTYTKSIPVASGGVVKDFTVSSTNSKLGGFTYTGELANFTGEVVNKTLGACVTNGSCINPKTNTCSYKFVNFGYSTFPTIYLTTEHRFSVDSESSLTYLAPNQAQFVLSDPNKLFTSDSKYLFIGELYRDYDSLPVDEDTRYGGITESAVENNTFVTAGPLVSLDSDEYVYRAAETSMDVTALLEQLNAKLYSGKYSLNIVHTNSTTETIALDTLTESGIEAVFPTKSNPCTLQISKNADGNYIAEIKELADSAVSEIIPEIVNSENYKLVVCRYGYARRGKYRKYINKYGSVQTSHTDRKTYRLCRGGKKYRIIGADLLYSKKSMEQQTESSTWKTTHGPNKHSRIDYTQSTLVTELHTKLVLPPLRPLHRAYLITADGRVKNTSREGIVDLYLCLVHKTSNGWVPVSNYLQVRGRSVDNTKVWEFEETNIVYE